MGLAKTGPSFGSGWIYLHRVIMRKGKGSCGSAREQSSRCGEPGGLWPPPFGTSSRCHRAEVQASEDAGIQGAAATRPVTGDVSSSLEVGKLHGPPVKQPGAPPRGICRPMSPPHEAAPSRGEDIGASSRINRTSAPQADVDYP